MILPQVHGQNTQQDFYLYAACDSAYFDQFVPALVNSILINTDQGIHLHLFNPRNDQIKFCQQLRVSATWETVSTQQFDQARINWNTITKEQQQRTETAMAKGGDVNVQERLMRTYFACARFIRLHEQFNGPVLAIDVDAVVRKSIPILSRDVDVHLHRIFGKKARCLAGALYLNSHGKDFLTAYAVALKNQIAQDYLYWGVDQDLLDRIVPLYNHGQLPKELIDWEMRDNGVIWTAKGKRKDLEIFKNELRKYQ